MFVCTPQLQSFITPFFFSSLNTLLLIRKKRKTKSIFIKLKRKREREKFANYFATGIVAHSFSQPPPPRIRVFQFMRANTQGIYMVFQPSYKLLLSLELLKIPRERERLSEEEREKERVLNYSVTP